MLLRVAQQRNEAARVTVDELRAQHPEESPDELIDRVVRQCVRDLAVGGAMTGGAAAAPAAGLAGTAAILGLEGANVARLGEMVMAIGILHGHENATDDDRALWVAAALGATEGTAVGLTGLAARAGARGSARLLARVPASAASATGKRLGRIGSRMATKGGPWGLAALLPYGIGASVGAAGNAALALSVGRAAQRWFSDDGSLTGSSGADTADRSTTTTGTAYEEIWDVEVVSERILDPE